MDEEKNEILSEIRDELSGIRDKLKHFQHLTEELGIEHFKAQLSGVMALLRASPNKLIFERLFQRAYGEQMRQRQFPFMDDLPEMPE